MMFPTKITPNHPSHNCASTAVDKNEPVSQSQSILVNRLQELFKKVAIDPEILNDRESTKLREFDAYTPQPRSKLIRLDQEQKSELLSLQARLGIQFTPAEIMSQLNRVFVTSRKPVPCLAIKVPNGCPIKFGKNEDGTFRYRARALSKAKNYFT